MTITVTRDRTSWDRTIAALDRMASGNQSKNLIVRAGIKSANVVGKQARSGLQDILAEVAGATSRHAVKLRSKAASKFQAEPRYTVELAKAIPIGKLKSTKYDKKTGELEFKSLAGKIQRFSARKLRGRGARFQLPTANPLPERLLGGLVFTRRHRNPEVERFAGSLGAPLAEAFETELEFALARINRR